jgi:fermentation-respiration switch protein FrsA (DUF1100 family)
LWQHVLLAERWLLAYNRRKGRAGLLESIVNQFIYYPEPEWAAKPEWLGLQAEEVHLLAEDGVAIHSWFFPNPAPCGTLLFCHGNAGNASHRLENVRLLVQSGFQVLLFDYRGYGHSGGQPSEEGLYRDAQAAWAHLVGRSDTAGAPRIIFGRSLGGAVAVDLATHVKADGLIIESTFTSIRTLARLMFSLPMPELPVKYDSLAKIGRLAMPLLAIHGQRDELIPYSDGRRLFDAAPEPKSWYSIAGAGHNDTYLTGGEAYFHRLVTFAHELRTEDKDDNADN